MVYLGRYGLAFLAGIILPASNAAAKDFDFTTLETVPDDELASQRGKFVLDGMTINFGAQMRTFFGQDLVLETTLQWTDQGAITTQVASPALTEVSAQDVQNGVLGSGNIQITMGNSNVFLGNDGQTALIHRTEDPIGSVLVNTGAGVNAYTQVEAVLDISGFDAFRSGLMQQSIGNNIVEQIGLASGGIPGS